MPQLVYISAQLARGLNHLARNRVVHADIATRNCLYVNPTGRKNEIVIFFRITGQLQVMITDGVLGSDLYPDEYDSIGGPNGERLPVKWMAAETLAGGPCRTESNVVRWLRREVFIWSSLFFLSFFLSVVVWR